MRESEHALQRLPEYAVVPKSELARPEQMLYYLAWHRRLRDQKKVLYNAMGPDISSVLFFANPTEVIGVDPARNFSKHSRDYVGKLWSYIDKKPILPAGSIAYSWGVSAASYVPDKEENNKFRKDLADRKRRGYWDMSVLHRWDIDRLFFMELKMLGVNPKSISVSIHDDVTDIEFMWAYPGERAKKRIVHYVSSTLDEQSYKDYAAQNKLAGVDCFFQKALPFNSKTTEYVRAIRPALADAAVVAVGHTFAHKTNIQYRQDIQTALGNNFSPMYLPGSYEKMIDDLDGGDPYFEENNYGMKLHVFRGYDV